MAGHKNPISLWDMCPDIFIPLITFIVLEVEFGLIVPDSQLLRIRVLCAKNKIDEPRLDLSQVSSQEKV